MNRVTIINLNGNAYQLEESGYEALRSYLDNAARRLEGNPDKAEIMADIEQAIADKFQAVLGTNKNVVMTKEVETVLAAMGPVQDGNESNADATAGKSAGAGSTNRQASNSGNEGGSGSSTGAVKRLYSIREGAMIAGVCNGLAAYFNIDVTIVRLAFVILTLLWGAGALVYLVMAIVIPTANTPEEKAAAFGGAATAQEFIRRAREGYYEGMKSIHDKDARREWKRKFKQQMRGWKQNSQYYWHQNKYDWSRQGIPPLTPMSGPGVGLPTLWLIRTLIKVAGIFAVYSLVTRGSVFGIGLPAGVPLWVGIVVVVVLWKFVAYPFKAMSWYATHPAGYGGGCGGPFGGFCDFIVGLAVLVLVVWFADHHIPQFHEALKQVPPLLHQGVDSIQHSLDRH
jgi:phage shock protein PspC (stress-responsive transcriptional regulator)